MEVWFYYTPTSNWLQLMIKTLMTAIVSHTCSPSTSLSLLCPLGFVIGPHLSPASHGEFWDAVRVHDCTAVKRDCLKLERFRNSRLRFNLLSEYVFQRLLDVKAFGKWTYCRFRDTRRPPTQLLSACREQQVNKQHDYYPPILQTCAISKAGSCASRHNELRGTKHLVLDFKWNVLLDITTAG